MAFMKKYIHVAKSTKVILNLVKFYSVLSAYSVGTFESLVFVMKGVSCIHIDIVNVLYNNSETNFQLPKVILNFYCI